MSEKQAPDMEQLWSYLSEDVDSDEESELLRPVVARLSAWQVPRPTAAEKADLMTALLPALPVVTQDAPFWLRGKTAVSEWWPWLLIRAQARVVRREIWAASFLVMVLGVFVSIIWEDIDGVSGLPLVLVAPLVAATGVGLLYGAPEPGIWEIEMVTAVPARLILLVRLLLVFGFDLGLGVLGSVMLALFRPDVAVWTLVVTWLAPMTFLSAFAFLITILARSTELGMLLSFGLWGAQTVRLATGIDILPFLPDMMTPAAQPWLWGLALLLAGGALWLGGRAERWLGGDT
jgi:hypothetical protein